jgi:hypothetical protein
MCIVLQQYCRDYTVCQWNSVLSGILHIDHCQFCCATTIAIDWYFPLWHPITLCSFIRDYLWSRPQTF